MQDIRIIFGLTLNRMNWFFFRKKLNSYIWLINFVERVYNFKKSLI